MRASLLHCLLVASIHLLATSTSLAFVPASIHLQGKRISKVYQPISTSYLPFYADSQSNAINFNSQRINTLSSNNKSPLFGRSKDKVASSKDVSVSVSVAVAVRIAVAVAVNHRIHRIRQLLGHMKRQAALGFFGLFMAWTFMAEAAFARTGGRAGGSLKQAPMRMHSRPSPSRNYNNHYNHYNHYRPPSGRGIFAPPTRLYYHRGPPPSPVVITTGPQSQLFQPYGPPMKYRYRRRVSLTEIALATGTALFIVNGVSNRLQANGKQTNSSALGPGFTMAKVTVSLSVPDRDAPHSIFKALQTISSTARTDTRAGVQQLISNGMFLLD